MIIINSIMFFSNFIKNYRSKAFIKCIIYLSFFIIDNGEFLKKKIKKIDMQIILVTEYY